MDKEKRAVQLMGEISSSTYPRGSDEYERMKKAIMKMSTKDIQRFILWMMIRNSEKAN